MELVVFDSVGRVKYGWNKGVDMGLRVSGFLVGVFLWVSSAHAFLVGTSNNLNQFVYEINQSGILFPKEDEEKLKKYKFLFVSGYLNEGMPRVPLLRTGYWYDNVEALKSFGLSEDTHIFEIAPSSWRSVESNIPVLRKKILSIPLEDDEQLVVIGHSKGAFLSTATVSRMIAGTIDKTDPDFVRKKIKAVFPIEMAAGSQVADHIYYRWGFGMKNSPSIPWEEMWKADKQFFWGAVFAVFGMGSGALAQPLKLCGALRGLKSITTMEADKLIDKIGDECSTSHAELNRIILHVGGGENVGDMPVLLRPTGVFLEHVAPVLRGGLMLPLTATSPSEFTVLPPSDGLAPVVNQRTRFLAQTRHCQVAFFKMDHATPTQRGRFVTDDPTVMRQILMGAIARLVVMR